METISTSSVNIKDLMELSNNIAQLNLGYLGISVAILGALGGVFYFFNIRPIIDTLRKQEDKINSLKEEASKLLEESREELSASIELFKKDQEESLTKSLERSQENTLLEVENKISNLEKELANKFEIISEGKDVKLKEILLSETTNRLSSLEKSILIKLSTQENDLSKKIETNIKKDTDFESDLKIIKRDIKELKIYMYDKEGKMGSIINSIELLKEDIDEKSWRIPGSLEKLKEMIKGTILDADYITQIEEQLTRIEIEQKYNILIKEIRANYIRK